MTLVWAFLNSALAAFNVWVYAAQGSPVNLAVGVFCGLSTIVLTIDRVGRRL